VLRDCALSLTLYGGVRGSPQYLVISSGGGPPTPPRVSDSWGALCSTNYHSYQLLHPIGRAVCEGDCECDRASRLGRRRRQATSVRLGGQPIVSASRQVFHRLNQLKRLFEVGAALCDTTPYMHVARGGCHKAVPLGVWFLTKWCAGCGVRDGVPWGVWCLDN
jgi:hypothetical protein